MKEIIREWLPLWTVAFVGGNAIGAMIALWCFCSMR